MKSAFHATFLTALLVLLSTAAFATDPVTIDGRTTFYGPDGSVVTVTRTITSFAGDGSYTRVMSEDADLVLNLDPWFEKYDAKSNTFSVYDIASNTVHRNTDPGPFVRAGYVGKLPADLPPGPEILGYKTVVRTVGSSKFYHAPALFFEPLLEEHFTPEGKPHIRHEVTGVYKVALPAKFWTVRSDAEPVVDPETVFERHEQKRGRELPACMRPQKQ